jgi:hypothetical protein
MSVQSSAQIPLGLATEPPVSLPPEEGPDVHASPATNEAPQALRPPPEAQLVQQGKLSMGQLAQAHRDRLEKGGSVLDIVVERGWVSAEEVAELRANHGLEAAVPPPAAQSAPEAEPEPEPAQSLQQTVTNSEAVEPAESVPHLQPVEATEPVQPVQAEPEPQAQPSPSLQQTVTRSTGTQRFAVAIRLTNGELITAGHADDEDKAQALGQVIAADLASAGGDSWPFFDGRYIRPETIVSVDIVVDQTEPS